jgi:DNA-binding NtrC family response regulator
MSKTLLLINDRRGIARTIRSIAPDLGLDIVALDDTAQVATRLAEIAPDVVVIDKAVAADELIELLRSVLRAAADARILIAARADDPSARVMEGMTRFHAGERVSFLRRPFSRKRIIAALQAVLGAAALLAALAYLLAATITPAATNDRPSPLASRVMAEPVRAISRATGGGTDGRDWSPDQVRGRP